MSQALVTKLLEEALSVANDAFGRRAVDRATQEVRVSRANIKNAFKEAFSKEHSKEFEGQTCPFTETSDVFNKAADAAFKALHKHLDRKNTKSNLVSSNPQQIIFSQPKYYRTPFTVMKKAGIKVINEHLKNAGREVLSTAQEQSIQRGAERLHTETTAGLARLAYTLNALEKNKKLQDTFFKSDEFKKLKDKYGDVQASYEVIQVTRKGKQASELKYRQKVSLHVAPKRLNYAGSEHNDWKKVKPELEKVLTKWVSSLDMADQEASQSPIDNMRGHVVDMVAEKFGRSKIAKVKKKPRKTKPLKSKSKPVTDRAKTPASVGTVAATWSIGNTTVTGASATPLALIAEFNRRLPQKIAENMQSPALNYQTGRFASSVRVVDAVKTPQGFNSFGYTYQKYPYQTFEPGFAQGDPNRDPRKLIDKSMREIAVEFAIGRFYTRRV